MAFCDRTQVLITFHALQIAAYLATHFAHIHVKGWLSNYTK